MGLACKHGLKQYAAALYKNQLAVQPILFVKADIAREPERANWLLVVGYAITMLSSAPAERSGALQINKE
jgi:hypothetical protein